MWEVGGVRGPVVDFPFEEGYHRSAANIRGHPLVSFVVNPSRAQDAPYPGSEIPSRKFVRDATRLHQLNTCKQIPTS